MPIPLGILAAAGFRPTAGGSYELIETYTVGAGGIASVTFNVGSYSTTYQHLQVRWVSRGTQTGTTTQGIYSRLNADTGNNYNGHFLIGTGSAVQSGAIGTTNRALTGVSQAASATASAFGAGVIDLLDPYEAKNKTFRTLSGATSGNRIDLHSALWMNTASVTSWTILPEANDFVQGSRFSIYGLKASA